jgi:hypothetical protein
VITMTDSTSEQISEPETWDTLLTHYRHAAVEILALHLRTEGRCGACGQPWPCMAACAAEATLEL